MNDALERVAERLRQLHQGQQTRANAGGKTAAGPLGQRANAQIVGMRVFDTISGQEGEVVGRTTENVIVPAAVK
jgi:hypothetical protein